MTGVALRLEALGSNSGYIMQERERVQFGRTIYRYIRDTDDFNLAARSIQTVLQNNPSLIFLSSSLQTNELSQTIQNQRYLIINDITVCLTDRNKAHEDVDELFKDIHFSEAIIEEPVKCTQGHVFERRYIEVWDRAKENICPYEHNTQHRHVIGAVRIDQILRQRIQTSIRVQNESKEMQKKSNSEIDRLKAQNLQISTRTNALERAVKPHREIELVSGTAKIILKIVASTTKKVAKEVAEEATKQTTKKLPIVSVLVGCVLGCYRVYNGYTTNDKSQYFKAVAEIGSGIAACFPGLGTGISIGIDAVIACHDIYQISPFSGGITITLDEKGARELLGLSLSGELSRQEVDSAYREYSRIFHPDRMNQHGQFHTQELGNMQSLLNEAATLLRNNIKVNL